jgi:ketosteroid isomerase-like protein
MLLPASAGPGGVKPPPAIEDLVLAERAFARASVENGMREAFLAYLAEDAVVFRPGPVPARAWVEKLPPVAGRLSWEPLFADVSRAGDLGYTTGPWQFTPAGGDPKAQEPSHGHYVSIWVRDSGGPWRVIVDLGNNHPRPENLVGDLRFPERGGEAANRRAGPETDPAQELLMADRRFAELAATGGTSEACGKWASDEIRVYRSNRVPVTGKTKACAELDGTAERAASQPIGSGLARAGDLGYVYGDLEFLPE